MPRKRFRVRTRAVGIPPWKVRQQQGRTLRPPKPTPKRMVDVEQEPTDG